MGANMRRIVAWAMTASLLLAFLQLPAKALKGARVMVERKDSAAVSGELLMVKRNCLVVDGQAGGVIVDLGDVRSVRIVKKSKAGAGFLVGLLGGTLIGYGLSSKSPCSGPMLDAGMSVLFVGLPSGALGALIGLVLGKDPIMKMDETKPQYFLLLLNRHARIIDASPLAEIKH